MTSKPEAILQKQLVVFDELFFVNEYPRRQLEGARIVSNRNGSKWRGSLAPYSDCVGFHRLMYWREPGDSASDDCVFARDLILVIWRI
jgi:hypothetical protein